jgi:hypothetical protein
MLSDSSASATAASSTDAQTDTQGSLRTIGEQWAASTRALIAGKQLPHERRRFFEALAGFAERTGCAAVTNHEIDLWGYGTVKVSFADNDGNWWAPLAELVEPTGLDFNDLRALYWDDVEEGRDDVEELSWVVDDPGPGEEDGICLLEFVGPGFGMRAMTCSPWSAEFTKALMPTFRRAMLASGLADQISPFVRIKEDGTAERVDMTMTEFLASGEPVPTRDEARDSAFRGPGGGL